MTFNIRDGAAVKRITENVVRYVDVATETCDDYARLTPIALRLLGEPTAKVAVVGLGFGILPRLLSRHHQVTAFEIEPGMVQWFWENHRWAPITVVQGDYQATLRATFDFIVYDLGGEPPAWLEKYGQVIVA